MAQAASSTGATRSRARPMGSSGQRRRVRMMPVGTAKSSPPKEERPPCQMAKTCAGLWV